MDFFIKHIIVWQNWTTNWLKTHWKMTRNKLIYFFINFIVRLSSVLRGFHPCHNSQWPPTMISIPDFIQYIFCPIFILEKEPVYHFLMLSAKLGNYWYHFYNVFCMTRSLTGDWTRDLPLSKPAFYHLAIEEAVQTDLKNNKRLETNKSWSDKTTTCQISKITGWKRTYWYQLWNFQVIVNLNCIS